MVSFFSEGVMYKQFIAALIMILVSSWAFANTGEPAVTVTESSNNEIVLPITLNNQANVNIITDSTLIPKLAQNIAPQGSELFDLKIPAQAGTKRIRYSNDINGCDFYITVSAQPGLVPVAYIAAIPINNITTCNVLTLGGVNHLSVSFMKLGF